ncbi:MAG: hypothetical protein IAE80_24240 [Anaerolinea sp.]|nr:hypothetical protein [Anaerolinea sp.]
MNRREFLRSLLAAAAVGLVPPSLGASGCTGRLSTASIPVFSINPDFDPAQLGESQRQWYDRMWAALRDPNQYPDIQALAADSAPRLDNTPYVYSIGYGLKSWVYALYGAFYTTGEQALLDEVIRMMNLINHETLTYFADLYESMLMSCFTLHTFVLFQNQAQYGDEFERWMGIINARLANRQNELVYNLLAHSTLARCISGYLLYRMTGSEQWNETARSAFDDFNTIYIDHTSDRLLWYHDGKPEQQAESGYQPMNYVRYSVENLVMLALTGSPYTVDMTALAQSVLGTINADGTIAGNIAGDVDYEGLNWTPDKWSISNLTQMARWDASGELARRSAYVWSLVSYHETRPHVSAALLSL